MKFVIPGLAAAALIPTAAEAASWHVEKENVTYGIEQQPRGIALLIANGSDKEVLVSPADINLVAGKQHFPVCTIFHMELFGMGAPGISVGVKPGKRQVFLLGGCVGPPASLGNPLAPPRHLTKVTIAGHPLSRGEPILPARSSGQKGEREQKPPAASPAPARPERAPSTPTIAVQPRPLGTQWIGAVEKAYFAGPRAHGFFSIRNSERNSEPASVRFIISVDEQGRMTNCQILASSGYADWREEFCGLTMNSDLRFTPAESTQGRAMPGEYVSSAVVAFR